MQPKIYCLMATGVSLTDAMRDLLFYTALGMATERIGRRTFKSEECEGEITTEFRTASLGTYGGLVFEARIEGPSLDARVRYIVQHRDLEGLEDVEWVTVPAYVGGGRPSRAGDAYVN